VKSKDGKTMQPLCMAQHYQMFRIYRRPGVNVDEQIILDRASSGDHIIVAHHNQVIIGDSEWDNAVSIAKSSTIVIDDK